MSFMRGAGLTVLHHSPFWSNSLEVCLGSLCCWTINDCPIKCKSNGMPCHCYCSHDGWVCLHFWVNFPHYQKLSAPIMLRTMHVETIHSPFLHCTKTQRLERKISNFHSLDQSTNFNWSNVYSLCFVAQTNVLISSEHSMWIWVYY